MCCAAHLRLSLHRQVRGRRPGTLRNQRGSSRGRTTDFRLGIGSIDVRSARCVAGSGIAKFPGPRGKSYWDRTTVWGILKNPAYVGQARFGKTRVGQRRPRLRSQRGKQAQPRRDSSVYDTPLEDQIAIAVPAIVDEPIFAAVADQLAENRQRRRERQCGSRYLLQGLLVCEKCGYAYYGKPLSISSRKGKSREYAYYRCVGTDAYRFGGQRVCSNRQCRTDLIDQAVWQDVCSLLSDPERVRREHEIRSGGRRRKSGRPADRLVHLISSLRRGITRLIDAYQEGFVERRGI